MRKTIALLMGIIWAFAGLVSWTSASASTQPLPQSQAVITSPQDNATVRGKVPIVGSASHPNFWKYEVHYAREPIRDNWVLIGTVHERPVVNGTLETWDTTLVPDGSYSLRLRVVRKDGNYEERYVRGLSVANTKPTETPTPPGGMATPTVTPTPLPPTPTVMIELPVIPTPIPRPTATPRPSAPTSPVSLSGISLSEIGRQLGNSFCLGSGAAVAIFLALGVLAALRAAVRWLISLIFRR